ncbi:MAG TPA: glycoside hydrolase family 27 protein [Prolixibacteraceae bacterium]|nr:glycoside hydrolase family 27 protein [Prolixibacteraceae bacterium]
MKKILFVILLFSTVFASAQKFQNLALTPPMGWNSWNKFQCNVSEKLIKETADALVSTGMRDAGYQYIVIDDCWQVGRDSMGFIIPDPERFPSGIKALADYVHSKGLKFGIYSCAGTKTCAGRPGGRGHEFQDAYMYAKWGVDYLKYDWCSSDGQNQKESYKLMSRMLKEAGRPIVFSICEWGGSKPWEWAGEVGHLWRTTGDITDCFDCENKHPGYSNWGVMKILDMQKDMRQYAGPGHWNDPDMLEVGNGGMKENEDRAHFSMWCMIAAPLIAGNELKNMSAQTHAILTNADAIAINQDVLGIQGFKYKSEDGLETWLKPLSGGDWAICFLNRSAVSKMIEFDWMKNVVSDTVSNRKLDAAGEVFKIKDVWAKKELGNTQKVLKAEVKSHDVLMVRLSLVKK